MGTVSASLLAYASIQALQPDVIINAGTAGGFKVFQILAEKIYAFSEFLIFELYNV